MNEDISIARFKSLSARRAWIEMQIGDSKQIVFDVALRKESVDRNNVKAAQVGNRGVALRKESVDRNLTATAPAYTAGASLSARRAWIEMRGRQF